MQLDKLIASLVMHLEFLLGFVVGSIFTALTGMIMNKHRVYLDAKKRHYDELYKETVEFNKIVSWFTTSGSEVLSRDPTFRRYAPPVAALDHAEKEFSHFFEHYPSIYRRFIDAINRAETHNSEVEQLKKDIEAFIVGNIKNEQKISRYLLPSGVSSLILFDLFEHEGFSPST